MKDYYNINYLKSKESLICPVCGKEFAPNDDTNYVACGGYTCSWKCFSNEAKKQELKKKDRERSNKQNKNN